MSVVPSIAAMMLQRGERSKGANCVLTRRSKKHRYSIISSARASSVGGTVTPSDFTVFAIYLSHR
jgi:hypothetical protein